MKSLWRATSALGLFTLCFSPLSVQAAAILNGDFETGDFTGWSQDVDGGPPSPGFNDFSIVGTGDGGHAARIEADYWETPGDIFSMPLDEVFFANTLYQELDTTAPADHELLLSFDWIFGGEDGDPDAGEIFLVGINDGLGNLYGSDGSLGFLIDPTTSYGGGDFSAVLDSTAFINMSGWFLDFQLGVGVDPLTFEPNGFGSFVNIDNVTLQEISTSVPEPSSFLLLGLGLISIIKMTELRKKKEFYHVN